MATAGGARGPRQLVRPADVHGATMIADMEEARPPSFLAPISGGMVLGRQEDPSRTPPHPSKYHYPPIRPVRKNGLLHLTPEDTPPRIALIQIRPYGI